tara:strand:- start:4402 stop:5370 length:969 start_codon:yes stop_codon:yes gene_type:complete
MNIFEYLGLSANHRKENKVTQLVKHWDEVVDKNKQGKNYIVQTKRDGVCSLTIILKGKVAMFSRTGKLFTNTSALVKRIVSLNLPDGVYMGELWVPKDVCSLEQLSGIVNPNRVNEVKDKTIPRHLRVSFFDLVSVQQFISGVSYNPFRLRSAELRKLIGDATHQQPANGIDALKIHNVKTEKDIDRHLEYLVYYGEEGLVIRDLDANWEAGHKGWRSMKKVRHVDYDLKCIGWEEGTGKFKNKVANLIFEWKAGNTIKAMLGRGWTHEMAEKMFMGIQHMDVNPVGKIFQVYGLEESSKGKLRLPKVGEKRFDKDTPDVQF